MTKVGTDASPYECFSDNFDGGTLLTRPDVVTMLGTMHVDYHPHLLQPISETDVLLRMCRNLMHIYNGPPCNKEQLLRVLDMALVLQPENLSTRQLRGWVGLKLEEFDLVINDNELQKDEEGQAMVQKAVELKAQCEKAVAVQQRRPRAVTMQVTGHAIAPGDPEHREPLFHVGMVVTHMRHNFIGVVHGWEPKYSSNLEWNFRLESQEMDTWKQQPFYTLLVHDDSVARDASFTSTCVAEDTIRRMMPGEFGPLGHAKLAEHFIRFDEDSGCFVPNEYLRYRYPDDLTSQGPSGLSRLTPLLSSLTAADDGAAPETARSSSSLTHVRFIPSCDACFDVYGLNGAESGQVRYCHSYVCVTCTNTYATYVPMNMLTLRTYMCVCNTISTCNSC
jgi:hemimethylated DNA binding protein